MQIQQGQQKMKSKKKLIYKLHENINQNPFKKIDQASFRNAGTGSYDYNKLKSIRAISLKGLGSDEILGGKQADWKQKYDLKLNMASIKQQIHQNAQQALICNKKKIIVDKSLISMQPKKLNVRILLKEKHFQTQRDENQNQINFNTLENNQTISDEEQINQNDKNLPKSQHKYELSDQQGQKSNNRNGHSRNISLPLINNHKQSTYKSIRQASPKKRHDPLLDEQRAKEQILKQVRINAQQKINKQVLMSIKLKSIQNLQKIARSQSQVIKIDKWKERYSHLKNGQQTSSYISPKNIVHQMQQKLYNKQIMQNIQTRHKLTTRYMKMNQEKQKELQKSDIQVAKDLLNNVAASQNLSNQVQPILSYNSSVLHRQSPDLLSYEGSQENKSTLEQNFESEMLTKRGFKNKEFWYSQPLKVTVTKLKGRRNKQNQNLSVSRRENEKSIKKKGKNSETKDNINEEKVQKDKEKNLNIQTQSGLSPAQKQGIWKEDKLMDMGSPREFKTKSKLNSYTNTNNPHEKGPTRPQQVISNINPNKGIITNMTNQKKINNNNTTTSTQIRCKINGDENILCNIVEYGMPEQWEHKRYGDEEEQVDFDRFVENEGREDGVV